MILSYILNGLYLVLRLYLAILTFGIILTWIPSLYKFSFFRAIRYLTNGYLKYFSGIIVFGSIDFTSIFGILLYEGILDLLLMLF